ncbi:hypothetical protein MUK42_12902 [Musa troglodytarum]|uniref:Uncharacterized protein n=1 Tax=Musa troglodytarum TaxID=320322 RepID=A0A9E7K9N3_9LILI|nr:hypothetical protein MUK42_12902 [Musa troglodytarum]
MRHGCMLRQHTISIFSRRTLSSLPLPWIHWALVELVPYGPLLCCLPRGCEKRMTTVFPFSCCNGDAARDSPPGHRDHEPLDAACCILDQDWEAYLDCSCIWLLVHSAGEHEVCSRRHVC